MYLITTEEDRENQIIAFVGAIIISSVLILAMMFITLHQHLPENEEVIEYVEVNFGTDAAGYGKIQNYNKASDSPRNEDVKKENDAPKIKATPKPIVTPPTPKIETTKPIKIKNSPPPITSKTESPVEVPEKIVKPTKVEAKTPPIETPKPAPAPPKKEINNDALFKKSSGSSGSNGTTGKASGTAGNNNGDKPGTVGDQGNPNGKIDAGSLYGKPGGSAQGVALNVSGWGMGSRPQVNDDSDESGKIVFELKVDDSGDIISVKVKESTVSQSVVELYKRAVSRMKLIPKSENVPAVSTGTLTYIIKSK
jgi:outer membrane biosynthesis protein TonB